MNGAQRSFCWIVVTAVTFVSIVLGVRRDLPHRGTVQTAPRWSAHLAPLERAPLPPGREVSLVLPAYLSRLDARHLFFETVWWRPQVRWNLVRALAPDSGPAVAVQISPPDQVAVNPPPWREVWHSGWIHVLGRVHR